LNWNPVAPVSGGSGRGPSMLWNGHSALAADRGCATHPPRGGAFGELGGPTTGAVIEADCKASSCLHRASRRRAMRGVFFFSCALRPPYINDRGPRDWRIGDTGYRFARRLPSCRTEREQPNFYRCPALRVMRTGVPEREMEARPHHGWSARRRPAA